MVGVMPDGRLRLGRRVEYTERWAYVVELVSESEQWGTYLYAISAWPLWVIRAYEKVTVLSPMSIRGLPAACQ